jgi:hypothetical protein
VGFHQRVLQRRSVQLAIAIVIIGTTCAAVGWRRAGRERRQTREALEARLQRAADEGRGTMLQEMARIRDALRDVVDAPPSVRHAMMGELAGNDAERTAILLDDQSVTLFPVRVLRYVPDPPDGGLIDETVFAQGDALERHGDHAAAAQWFSELASRSATSVRAGALLRAARNDVRRKQPAHALIAYDELAQMRDVRIRREPAPLLARCERLPLLPWASRSTEAASIVRDLESGTWTLSRETYESYRDELEDVVSGDRAVPLWEEAVYAVRAASRATADRSGEVVIWVDESHPVLLIWRSRGPAAVALAVTGRYVAERWLRAQPGLGYGIERVDRQAFLPYPPRDPQTARILSFAGQEWRMITFAWP